MLQHRFDLRDTTISQFLEQLKASIPFCKYDLKRHVAELEDEQHESLGFIRLPLHVQLRDDLTVVDDAASALYLIIESGSAAICVMEGEKNVYHTTFSAYMTRKKQGFSQIKYLKKKGKSRAGSRVRLAETVTFFEKINGSVTALMEEYVPERVALSCSTTLIPFLYQSKVPFPVPKKDPLLYKIPVHIPQSNSSNLDAAIRKLRVPMLFYWEKREAEVRGFMEGIVLG